MYIFILIFSILYLIDNKPINLLIDFIGILLSLSIILINIDIIDISILSIIYIIIYASALAILFGFIVMLFSSEKDIKKNNIIINEFYLPLKLNYKTSFINIKYLYVTSKLFFYIISLIISIFIIILYLKFDLYLNYKIYLNSFEPSYLFINFNTIFNIFYSIFYYFFNLSYFNLFIIIFINILLLALIGIIYIII